MYSQIGDYSNANKCYEELQGDLGRKVDIMTETGYLQLESILLLNRGRNCLDSEDYDSAVKDFEKLLIKGTMLPKRLDLLRI